MIIDNFFYSKYKKYGLATFLILSLKYIRRRSLIYISRLLLNYIGVSKLPQATLWMGWRQLLLQMMCVHETSEFLLGEPHHFRALGVQDNILNVIDSDSAEGPETVNNPFNSEATQTYFWLPRRNYELANAVFDPRSGLVLINGIVVIESSHRFPKPDLWSANLAWRCRKPLRLDVEACSGTQWAYNYHHWLTEDLISVLRIRKQFGDQIPFIAPTKLARFQVEALNLLGVKRIEIDVPALCGRFLLAGQHQRSQAALRPSDISLLRQTFLPLAIRECSTNQDLDIYVSRSKSKGINSLIHEKMLEEMMRDRGFLVVFTQDLDFAEEIALFARARTIVGITGSGLANHMWMPPGGRFVEIRTNDYDDPSPRYTCPLLGLHVSYADCRMESFETPASVVMQKICECLEE